MSMDFWICEMMAEHHRQWFASLTLADIEARWIADGDGSTLTEYMEYLAHA